MRHDLRRLRLKTRLQTSAIFSCLLGLCFAAEATAQTPFSCDDDVRAFAVQDVDAQIYEIESDLTFTTVCADLETEVNNLCYNSADGLLYGVELTSNGNQGVVSIDANCNVTSLSLTGLPTNRRFDAGDCLPDGSKMFINIAGLRELYMVDLVNSTVTEIPVAAGPTGYVHDWAYNPNDGKLYGGDNTHGQLAMLELLPNPDFPTSAVRTDVNLSGLPSGSGNSDAYGGAWFDAVADRLFLHRNVGEVYEIDLSGPSVEGYTAKVGSTRNDATACTESLDCDHAYVIQEVDADVYRCDSSTPPFTCQMLCENLGEEINNAGFRTTDGLIYAVELDGSTNTGLLRMDPEDDCGTIEKASVSGWASPNRYDAGDVTPDGTTLFVSISDLSTLYRVDLTTWPSLTAVGLTITEADGAGGDVHDWAYNPADGKLYGGDNTHGELAILEIDGSGVTRTDVATSPSLPSGTAYGSAWLNADGDLVLHQNDGDVYEVDLGTLAVVEYEDEAPASSRNEGAVCRAPAP